VFTLGGDTRNPQFETSDSQIGFSTSTPPDKPTESTEKKNTEDAKKLLRPSDSGVE
jgi:hypothetical protein